MAKPSRTTLRSLTPDPRNANKGSERGTGMLEHSLRQYGAGRSLLVDKHGVVIAGNKTLEAAASLGMDEIQIVQSDGTKLVVVQRTDLDLAKDAKAKELAVADNRVAQVSLDWDADVLRQLADEGADLSALFTKDELADLVDVEPVAGHTDPDDVPEPRATDIKPGDLFQLGRHRLLCGDSTKAEDVARVMDGQRADLCFTSPPYNLGKSVGLRNGAFRGADTAYTDSSRDADDPAWATLMDGFTAQALSVSRYLAVNVQLLAGNKRSLAAWFGGLADRLADVYVWVKGNPQPAMAERVATSAFEFVFLYSSEGTPTRAIASASFRRGSFSNVYESSVGSNSHTKGMHGATFTADFAKHYIGNLTSDGAVVFEPFCGSGTSIVACEQLGRECYAMDIEPTYVQMAIDRWEAFTGQKAQKVGEVALAS